jgi:threonine dehydrogenase-like Zn-dependent dehydrogenase
VYKMTKLCRPASSDGGDPTAPGHSGYLTCYQARLPGPRQLELRELPVPDIDDESALLRVEACGICGSDAEQCAGVLPVRMPVVPGHEPLGVIARIGDRAARRCGVDVGDRVAVEALIRCGHCPACVAGRYPLCRGRGGMFGHGYVPLDHPPGLWGAYAEYMYLDAFSLVHKVRADLPASLAVMFNPLGAGFRWPSSCRGPSSASDATATRNPRLSVTLSLI